MNPFTSAVTAVGGLVMAMFVTVWAVVAVVAIAAVVVVMRVVALLAGARDPIRPNSRAADADTIGGRAAPLTAQQERHRDDLRRAGPQLDEGAAEAMALAPDVPVARAVVTGYSTAVLLAEPARRRSWWSSSTAYSAGSKACWSARWARLCCTTQPARSPLCATAWGSPGPRSTLDRRHDVIE